MWDWRDREISNRKREREERQKNIRGGNGTKEMDKA
jgi:hypothetical protein